jgi:hypothetical protein
LEEEIVNGQEIGKKEDDLKKPVFEEKKKRVRLYEKLVLRRVLSNFAMLQYWQGESKPSWFVQEVLVLISLVPWST